MSHHTWLENIVSAPRTITRPGIPDDGLIASSGIALPEGHVALLRRSNGLMLYDGYFRILGVGPNTQWGDLRQWNHQETWKFAWPDDLSRYLCFAETAWGDQYAYDLDDLTAGGSSVIFLDALRMEPRTLTEDFDGFASRFLERNATQPFDSVLRAAREVVGVLAAGTHLVFSPPTLLTGEERLDQIVQMEAREAMILNGDLWRQLGRAPDGQAVAGLQAVLDDQGRQRMNVIWA